MGKILDVAERYLRQQAWKFERSPDRPELWMVFSCESGKWFTILQERAHLNQLVVYSAVMVPAPEDRRGAVSEFITRINYGMVLGNFELDFGDGEVRCKTSVDAGDGEFGGALVEPVVDMNFAMMRRFLPGIMAVAFEGVDPGDAVEMLESARSARAN